MRLSHGAWGPRQVLAVAPLLCPAPGPQHSRGRGDAQVCIDAQPQPRVGHEGQGQPGDVD